MNFKGRILTITMAGIVLLSGAAGLILYKSNSAKQGTTIPTPAPTKSSQIYKMNVDYIAQSYSKWLAEDGITPYTGDINTFYGVDTMIPIVKDAVLYIDVGDGPIDYHPTKANLEATSRKDVYNSLINEIEFHNRSGEGEYMPVGPLFQNLDKPLIGLDADGFLEQLYKDGGYTAEELAENLADKGTGVEFDDNNRAEQLLKKYVIDCNYALITYDKEDKGKTY